jgi:hypothetical protein
MHHEEALYCFQRCMSDFVFHVSPQQNDVPVDVIWVERIANIIYLVALIYEL